MTQQKQSSHHAIHGWLALDKPEGMGSTKAVQIVKKCVGGNIKVGHGGTLDPLASGLLPIAIGEATKTVDFVTTKSKTYIFDVHWGEERNTDDREGKITATSTIRPSRSKIESILPRFTGDIEQTPPQFSAIKIAGKRAYDLARKGENPSLKPRIVHIEHCRIIKTDHNKTRFEVITHKGVYVRALARDMGRLLGCYGYVGFLRRITVGSFYEKDMILLDNLLKVGHKDGERVQIWNAFLYPVTYILDDIPDIAINEEEAQKLKYGQALPYDMKLLKPSNKERLIYATYKGDLIAIAKIFEGYIKPIRVFNI